MDNNINIDRFSISNEGGDFAIINTDDGPWVQFDDMDRVVQDLNKQINHLKDLLNKERIIVHTMKQHIQSPEYVICPRCNYPQEDTGLRKKECPNCEFEWSHKKGF